MASAESAVAPAADDWALTRSAHAALSPVDVEFRELARRDPQCLAAARNVSEHPARLLLEFTPQAWPLFISRRFTAELAAASVAVSQLLRSVPERVFGSDAGRMGACYGLEAGLLQLALRPPTGIPEALARGDFIYSSDGFRCVEFNIASNLGGWENRFLAEIALSIPPIRGFVERLGRAVTFRDPFRRLLFYIAHDVRAAGLAPDGELNVALSVRHQRTAEREALLEAHLKTEYAAALKGFSPPLSGTLWLCHPDALSMRHGALYHGDTRVHAVIDHQLDRIEPTLFRCFKAGGVRLYNTPISMLLSDKNTLAILSQEAESDAFTAEERRTIERHVPWSRRLIPGPVTRQGEREDLEKLVLGRREEMVIKRGQSMGGYHVRVGHATAPAEWEAAVRQALAEGGWIVQRVVESIPLLFQTGESGACAQDPVWGPFVFGSHYSGTNLRVQPRDRGGVVNVVHGATLPIVFEVEDPPPA